MFLGGRPLLFKVPTQARTSRKLSLLPDRWCARVKSVDTAHFFRPNWSAIRLKLFWGGGRQKRRAIIQQRSSYEISAPLGGIEAMLVLNEISTTRSAVTTRLFTLRRVQIIMEHMVKARYPIGWTISWRLRNKPSYRQRLVTLIESLTSRPLPA